MKTSFSKFIVILFALLLSNNQSFSQKKSEVSIGLGFPEMFNLKLKRGISFQTGLSIGYMPVINFLTISGDFCYHFPKYSENIKMNTWQLNSGLTFFNIFEGWTNETGLLYYARFGRTFNFKNSTGINLDFGVSVLLPNDKYTSYGPLGGGNTDYSLNYLFPSVSLGYFIRL